VACKVGFFWSCVGYSFCKSLCKKKNYKSQSSYYKA